MKRLQIITKPTRVADISDIESRDYDDPWLLKAEQIRIKQMRSFRQKLAM